jgi:hypothetical protein
MFLNLLDNLAFAVKTEEKDEDRGEMKADEEDENGAASSHHGDWGGEASGEELERVSNFSPTGGCFGSLLSADGQCCFTLSALAALPHPLPTVPHTGTATYSR